MRIAITGSSGLIGTALGERLAADGHEVVPVVRGDARPGTITWDPAAGRLDPADLEGLDGVVHLAGEGIGDKRWTDGQKRRVLDSRPRARRCSAEALAATTDARRCSSPARRSASTATAATRSLTERSGPGTGFLDRGVPGVGGGHRGRRGGRHPRRPPPHRHRARRRRAACCRSMVLPVPAGRRRPPRLGQAVDELDHARRRGGGDPLPARRTTCPARSTLTVAEPRHQRRAHQGARRGAAPADDPPGAGVRPRGCCSGASWPTSCSSSASGCCPRSCSTRASTFQHPDLDDGLAADRSA